jgi:exodeoxyribonuclease VII small subunit
MKSFEERLNRLESLSEKLREGKIPLEEAVSIFEEGMKLAKDLEKELAKIERKVEILVNEPARKSAGGDAIRGGGEEPVLELFPEEEESEE